MSGADVRIRADAWPADGGRALAIRCEFQRLDGEAGTSPMVQTAQGMVEIARLEKSTDFDAHLGDFITTTLARWFGELGVKLFRDEMQVACREAIGRAEKLREESGGHPGCCGD